MKRKVIYTDIPHSYDRDAERLVKMVGLIFALCLLSVAVLAIILH